MVTVCLLGVASMVLIRLPVVLLAVVKLTYSDRVRISITCLPQKLTSLTLVGPLVKLVIVRLRLLPVSYRRTRLPWFLTSLMTTPG